MSTSVKIIIFAAALALIGVGILLLIDVFKTEKLKQSCYRDLQNLQQKLDQERGKRMRLELENDEFKARLARAPVSDSKLQDRLQALTQEKTRLAELTKMLAEDKKQALELAETRLYELRQLQLKLLDPERSRPELATILEIEPGLRQKFPAWFALWSKALPGFRLEVFIREDERDLEDVTWSLDEKSDMYEDDMARMKSCVWSPDQNKCANPYWCWDDPDSCVMVVDLDKKLIRRVSFCGTPCSFDEAHWLDNDRFVVLGSSNEPLEGMRFYAEVLWYDLKSGKVAAYQGPPVEAKNFDDRYREFRKAKMQALGLE